MPESSRFVLVKAIFNSLQREYPTEYQDRLLRMAEIMADHELRFL